jgi:hypothetical protein
MTVQSKPYLSPQEYLALEPVVSLASVSCEMALSEIYDKIAFPEPSI